MREQLEQRLAQLTSELTIGQQVLSDLETRQVATRESLLRISGAVQVLEELLAAGRSASATQTAAD
jgi:hypothetical protein